MTTRRVAVRAGLALAGAALIAALGSCATRGECMVPTVAPPTAAARCAECHPAEARTWQDSPHAHAYVSSAFKEQTHDYTATECLSCHAPGAFPVQAPSATAVPAGARFAAKGGRPPLRKDARADGVTCVTCHAAGADTRPGATCAELFGHGEVLRSAAYCGRCHEDTLREWSALAAKKLDCAACHMPRAGEGEAIAADHSLTRGRDVQGKYAVLVDLLQAKRGGAGRPVEAAVQLENFAADHALPSGGYGFRDLRLTVELVDRTGRTVDARSTDLLVSGKGDSRALAARERREMRVELKDPDALGVAVRARLEKAGPSGPEATPRSVVQREVE